MIFQLCNGNVVFRFKMFDLLVALKRRERREKREKKREKKREREREKKDGRERKELRRQRDVKKFGD